jgi:hypothetical protein
VPKLQCWIRVYGDLWDSSSEYRRHVYQDLRLFSPAAPARPFLLIYCRGARVRPVGRRWMWSHEAQTDFCRNGALARGLRAGVVDGLAI